MNYCLNPYCKNPHNADNITVCLSCHYTILLENRYRLIQFIGSGGQVLTIDTYPVIKIVKPKKNLFQKIFNISPFNWIQTINKYSIKPIVFHSISQIIATQGIRKRGKISLWNWSTDSLITSYKFGVNHLGFVLHPDVKK